MIVSFFSFADINNLQSTNVGYYNGNRRAICCSTSYGPIFDAGSDLYHHNSNTWYSNSKSYPNIGIPSGDFNVSDYEVFQVIKK